MTDKSACRLLIAISSEKVDAYVRLDKEERTIRKAQRAFNDARLNARWSKRKSNDLSATAHDDALRIALLTFLATKAQSEQELETKATGAAQARRCSRADLVAGPDGWGRAQLGLRQAEPLGGEPTTLARHAAEGADDVKCGARTSDARPSRRSRVPTVRSPSSQRPYLVPSLSVRPRGIATRPRSARPPKEASR